MMFRSPILSATVWRMIALTGLAILTFGAVTHLVIEVEHWEYAEWSFLGAIFAWNAMVTTCCLCRGGNHWVGLLVLPLAILIGAATCRLIDSDLWEPILPMLSIHSLLVALGSVVTGFPRWRTADLSDDVRPRYSILSMLALTLAVAGLIVVARLGDLGQVESRALIVFFIAVAGGWVLGCMTFCLRSRPLRRAGLILLPLFCAAVWALVLATNTLPPNDGRTHSNRDDIALHTICDCVIYRLFFVWRSFLDATRVRRGH